MLDFLGIVLILIAILAAFRLHSANGKWWWAGLPILVGLLLFFVASYSLEFLLPILFGPVTIRLHPELNFIMALNMALTIVLMAFVVLAQMVFVPKRLIARPGPALILSLVAGLVFFLTVFFVT